MQINVPGFSTFTINPNMAQMEAMTQGIDFNNEGLLRQKSGDYEGAERCFQESLRLKRAAYPEDSKQVCIGLSGLADTYLMSGRFYKARQEAQHMKDIATRIRDSEQLRIANEILEDIAKAEEKGRERRCYNPKCPGHAEDVVFLLCGGCRHVFYCTSACQKSHWPQHKAICKK